RETMLTIYQALIISILDYGCMVYDAASATLLRRFDRIQYRVLRICLGATKTTSVTPLLVEARRGLKHRLA
ncbi:MAG: hypothetical protein ACRCVN_04365, partial [Spirochaetia bacterium]